MLLQHHNFAANRKQIVSSDTAMSVYTSHLTNVIILVFMIFDISIKKNDL